MSKQSELDKMVAIFQDHSVSNGYPMNGEHKRGAEIHKQAILDWSNKQIEEVLDRLSEQIKDNLTPDDLHLYIGSDRYNIYSKIEREYDSPDDTPDWENVELRVLLNGLREEVVGSIEAERKKLDV